MSGFHLAQFTKDHLGPSVELSSAAGWAHQRKDWEMLLPFSKGLVAIQDGRMIGTAIRSDFGPNLSTMNMVIVSQDQRGQGCGRALVTALLSDEDRTVRLVTTVFGRPLYQSLGFRDVAAVAQHQGQVLEVPDLPGAQDAAPGDMQGVLDLENHSFGGNRAALMDWLTLNARVSVVRRTGAVVGFAARRRFGRGYVIGPVVADDLQDAQALVAHLLKDLSGTFVRLDTLHGSGLSPWLSDLGLDLVGQPPIMQRGEADISPLRMALFSQALG